MIELLDIVTQTPIDEKPSHASKCPYCNGTRLRSNGSWTTLLGGDGCDTIDENPNHTHEQLTCNDCNAIFTRETKRGNVWYTVNHYVLRGMPNCFERYDYTCKKCKGTIQRFYTNLDGITPAKGLGKSFINGVWHQEFRIFYNCQSCGAGGETQDEYWSPK